MKTIWKFKLSPTGEPIQMPAGAIALTAAAQGDDIRVWAEVITAAPLRDRFFQVYGTGHSVTCDRGLTYVGTAFLPNGLVFHVYEQGPTW